jgi:hypothetical protein
MAWIGQEDLPFETIEEEILDPLKGVDLTETELCVAGLILNATVEAPIKLADIAIEAWRQRVIELTDRKVKETVRGLRRDHGFPICSRKGKPAGYWWANSEEEIAEFVKGWKAQYLDEATTLHKMLKVNYPRLAGQLRLELEA